MLQRLREQQQRELVRDDVVHAVPRARERGDGGVQLGRVDSRNASVHHIKDGKVVKLILYWDRDRALADLGVEE